MKVLAAAVLVLAVAPPAAAQYAPPQQAGMTEARLIHYRAHDGAIRPAWLLLPADYHGQPIPLVISPHGRGVADDVNALLWGDLPGEGDFAVVNPGGEGRRLHWYSWGDPGEISDLARMPAIVERHGVNVDPRRIYAFGGSMGGQETLLLLARHPKLLAGAAVFDAVSNFELQYRAFPKLQCNRVCRKVWHGPIGPALQSMARHEIGGSPKKAPFAWAARSPITYARAIARSCVPLQLWWSDRDRIVLDQRKQTGLLYDELLQLNPDAPVQGFNGFWRHSAEMHADARLPLALATFGLLPDSDPRLARAMYVDPAPQSSPWCKDFRRTG